MSFRALFLLALSLVFVGGCASLEDRPHVLSGEAPVDAVMSRADDSARDGDFRAAAILYRQGLRQEPSAEGFYRLGMSLRELGRAEEATAAFRSALSLEEDHIGSLERLALDLTARGQIDEALPYLQRLEGLTPQNWRVHNALGIVADLEGRFAEAVAHYSAALKLRPEAAKLWNNLGYSHYLAGDDEEALAAMRKALKLDPDYATASNNIALVMARRGEYRNALAVLARSGSHADAHADVGYLAFRLGDYDAAEKLLTEAIRLSPTYHKPAHSHLAAVRQARSSAAADGVKDLQESFMSSLDAFLGEG